MKKIDFCFTIVCSENYILETIGLIKNINRIYPRRKIFIVSLDFQTAKIIKKYNLKCQTISVKEIWGVDFYRNLASRMSTPEIAYASKSAAASYILKNFSKSLLILDADLLILKKIDDIIDFTKKYAVTVVSANRNLQDWKRTNKIGLFSAGIIGFSSDSLFGVEWWKEQCFANTNVNIFLGCYNEQKYLDYLLSNYETKIIRDYGINVSSTFLKRAKPYFNSNKRSWFSEDGKLIRIFHQSRVTDHPIYKKKLEYLDEDQKKKISFNKSKPI